MVLFVFKSEATNLTPMVVSYRRHYPFDNDKFKLQISYNLPCKTLQLWTIKILETLLSIL